MTKKSKISVEESSGNIFADLGFANPEQEQLKARRALQSYRASKADEEEEIRRTCTAIREGLKAVEQGKTMSLDKFDEEMRKKFRIPKKK